MMDNETALLLMLIAFILGLGVGAKFLKCYYPTLMGSLHENE